MNIPTSYYDWAGYIINTTTGMDSMGFYESSNLATHTFNETYTPDTRTNIGRYTVGSDTIFLFGADQDCIDTVLSGSSVYTGDGETTYSASYNIGVDPDGSRYAVATSIYDPAYGHIGSVNSESSKIFSCASGLDIEFVFSSPPTQLLSGDEDLNFYAYPDSDGMVYFECFIRFSPVSADGKSGLAEMYVAISTDNNYDIATTYLRWYGDAAAYTPSCLYDGSKNIVTFKIRNSYLCVYLNGFCIVKKMFSYDFLPLINGSNVNMNASIAKSGNSGSTTAKLYSMTITEYS